MKDKDKLILLFNININDVGVEDIYEYTQQTANAFNGWFDDSVKCVFAITKNDNAPAVQNITNFSDDGMDLIRNIVELYQEGDTKSLEAQINLLKDFLKDNGRGN